MGGGDLNLKKSWHPQTIRNVERVWKAEQKASAEAKKIEQLQRELLEERAREDMQRHAIDQGIAKKKSERLEWMYATPGNVDREQYLLGKVVDKHVDPLGNDDKEESNVPVASSTANVNTPADLAAKVRDDPLFLIKKKEEEKKKELLNNPIKMNHLRKMLQENLGKSKKKKEKKRKKKEKKEKRKKAKDSEESSDSDDERREKQRKRRHQRDVSPVESHSQHSKGHIHHTRRPSSQSPDTDHSPPRHSHRKRHQSHSSSPPRSKHQKHRTQSQQSRSRSPERKHRRKRSLSTSPLRYRHNSKSPVRNGYKNGLSRSPKHKSLRSDSPSYKKSRKYSPQRRRARQESNSPPRKEKLSPPRKHQHSRGSAVTKKMSAEELEKRREEMLSNAHWRNDQRTANVKKHTEIEKKEAEDEAQNAGKSAKFLSSMKVESFSSDSTASVSDRIKRNINSLQRTTAALDTFLVKK